ncbi:zinc/manganese transport system ATP-binding protein [Streptomyces sp. SAI-135]|uniref:metal ABC transporter ATP-binding protein n=1 Tax=unclassified Streptomyces TaxID=2593676 RepID=UPI002475F3CC|nr:MULTISPECIES: metal ABC transporter ATP-binding protein [unclassified Streptomyces]MDH6520819.1 zinc/manganese transport system ATP-binding protein [Streptomyces sp. SAI-090]MDH6572122.1 zinc/manganese transport system ATP-binding protein [Streptomyces sp. SAI-117]MDH6615089.1 zinc/manganese transport system ATP-binding protein [Streptomyces sp. SAI-135]
MSSVITLRAAALSYGSRTVWHDLDLDVRPGEFLAVLGPNGAGKTSFVRALLGRQPLSAGELTVLGRAPREAARHLGYVPQQAALSAQALLRARDLVRFGIDGHRFGPRLRTAAVRRRVDEILASVGASAYADVPVGLLSGGERQRVRVGQALATDPRVLLCDEPLLSLDLHHQRAVTELVDARRRSHGTAVVFVTHEINPVLGLVDRVLYLAPGGHRIGTPDEVLTSTSLSRLYGTRVDVLRVHGRVVVVGAHDEPAHHLPEEVRS